jgi:anti-sigma factor ChrR (cupin superfamily)
MQGTRAAPTGLGLRLDDRELAWQPTRYPGVRWLRLHPAEGRKDAGEDGEGDAAVLIRMDPGCGYPAHEHLGVEDVLLLQGGYRDEAGEHRAGTYLRYPPGSRHGPVALGNPDRPISPANPACILFAVARGGIRVLEPLP